MGYDTRFNVTVYPSLPGLDLNQHVSDPFFDNASEGGWYLGNLDGKWYNVDDDMLALSRLYPDHLFEVEGEGDENGDIWKTYYQNGKMQHCQAEIVIPEYDPEKMV